MLFEERKKWNSLVASRSVEVELEETQIKGDAMYIQVKGMSNKYYWVV
jgi:hypothetical protein